MEISHTPTDIMDVIGQLAECATEIEASALVKHVVELLGAQWFVYSTLLPSIPDKTNDSFRYFIGCRPELCALYRERKWMMNDPFFDYARNSSAPLTGSKIKVLTPGQAEMIRISAQYGFRSGMIVPTHTSMDASKRMGLLYIGSELPPEIGEPLLMQKRVQFGALGAELLLWWNSRLKQQAMQKYSLLEEEVETLQLSKNGKVAVEIAAVFDIKLATAYKRLNTIKEKLNVDRIEQAVIQADALGLLG